MKWYKSLLFLITIVISSCDIIDHQDTYYAKYEVESIDTRDDYTYLFVQTATDTEHLKFWCKSEWVQEFGPFYSGDVLYINVDAPNLDTFLARIYIKKGKSGEWQLVEEGWNQAEYVID